MAQTTGIIDIVWRSTRLSPKKGGQDYRLGGLKANSVVAGRRVHYSHEMESSMVKVTVQLERGMALLPIWAGGPGELQVLLDSGQSYTVGDAFLTNRPNFNDTGEVELTWEGSEAEEILNG